MPVVVDASALVELLGNSPRATAVLQAVGESQMLAPDVIDTEVLSAIRRLERAGTMLPERAEQAVDDFVDSAVRRVPVRPLLRSAWSMHETLSACDAVYVALARTLSCALVTGDRRLARAPGLDVAMLTI